MQSLKLLVSLLLPLLVLGGPKGDKNEPIWDETAATDDYTLNPKTSTIEAPAAPVKDDYFPEPQKTAEAPEPSRTTQTESESTGNEESEPAVDDPEIDYLLKRLIEDEMLKQSHEDKQLNATSNPAVNAVKTPLTFMTPPPPPKDEDLSTTAANDSQESDEEASTPESTNTDADVPSKKQDKSSSEEAFPADEDKTRSKGIDQDQSQSNSATINTKSPKEESETSDENEIHQYAEKFSKYQKEQPRQDFDTRNTDDQEESDQPKEIPPKATEEPEDSREIETSPSTTPLPPTATEDDTSETTQPDQTNEADATISPPRSINHGMDQVIFDKEEPPADDSTSSNSELQEEPLKEKYYFFLRPRPTIMTPPSSFHTYQRYPSRYTYTEQPQQYPSQLSPTYYNPYLLRPANNFASSSESSPQFMTNSEQQSNIPSSLYQFQSLQPSQQQMLPNYDYYYDHYTMPNPIRSSFPSVFPPMLQRPQMNYYYNSNYNTPSSSPGLGFSGDYMRNPYFWTNPYNSIMSMHVPQQYQYQQRVPIQNPNAQLFYAF